MNNYREAIVKGQKFENVELAFSVLLGPEFNTEKYVKIKDKALAFANEREKAGWNDVEIVETVIHSISFNLQIVVNTDGGKLKTYFHTSYSCMEIYSSELPRTTPFGSKKVFYNRFSTKKQVDEYKLFDSLIKYQEMYSELGKLKAENEGLMAQIKQLQNPQI